MGKALIQDLGQSLSFGRLPLLAKVLWPMLLAAADDQGRGLAEADAVKWYVCPNVHELTPENVPEMLQAMADQGMVLLYQADGHRLFQVVKWWRYQKLQWIQPSKYAPPEGWTDTIRKKIGLTEVYTENYPRPEQPINSGEHSGELIASPSPEPSIQAESNIKQQEQNRTEQQHNPSTAVAEETEPESLIRQLVGNEMDAGVAKNLVEDHPDRIQPALDYLRLRLKRGDDIENPAGMLRRYIEGDWHPPPPGKRARVPKPEDFRLPADVQAAMDARVDALLESKRGET